MSLPFHIALSGLNAASAGLRTTANNIANASTDDFKSSRVEFAALPNGDGVRVAQIREYPRVDSKVDLADQLIRMIRYSQQHDAQMAVLRTVDENARTIASM